MDKVGAGVVAHASAMQCQCGIANFGGAHTRDADIYSHRLHMQAVARDAVSVRPEILVAPRCPISTHDIDLSAGTS